NTKIFHIACFVGMYDIVNILSSKFPHYVNDAAMFEAIQNGHLDIVKLLYPFFKGDELKIFFLHSAHENQLAILQYFFQFCETPSHVHDLNDETVLIIAASNNYIEMVKWLSNRVD